MSGDHRGSIQSMVESTTYLIPTTFESPIQNIFSNISYSQVGDERNLTEVGVDDLLQDTHAIEGMFLNAFQQYEIGNDDNVVDAFFEMLKSTPSSAFFGHGLSST